MFSEVSGNPTRVKSFARSLLALIFPEEVVLEAINILVPARCSWFGVVESPMEMVSAIPLVVVICANSLPCKRYLFANISPLALIFWDEVILPLDPLTLTLPCTMSPFRATNSFAIFLFSSLHCPKGRLFDFYVYINMKKFSN